MTEEEQDIEYAKKVAKEIAYRERHGFGFKRIEEMDCVWITQEVKDFKASAIETILMELEKKDKTIKEMAEYFADSVDCGEKVRVIYSEDEIDFVCKSTEHTVDKICCKECWKQYFERKVEV